MSNPPPSSFLCPITQSVMTDPVIGSDGITYERAAITEWLSRGNRTSPVTRGVLSLILIPNFAIKSAIEESLGGGRGSRGASAWVSQTCLPQFATRSALTNDDDVEVHIAGGGFSDDWKSTTTTPPPNMNPIASMMSIHTRDGGCFLGATRIQMHDATWKRADQIQPGDYVAHGYYVRCVVKILNTTLDSLEIVPTRYGGITPWHPVYVDGRWQHPANCSGMPKVAFTIPEPVYNFVLTDGHTVIADGYTACTLAHTFTTDDVIRHPYYGAREGHHRNVMDDLEASKGWDVGFVIWRNPVPIREGGRVVRMVMN
jgi:Hint-domain/U-box domain